MERPTPRILEKTESLSLFQVLVLCLSVFVLAALAAETFLPLRPEVRELLLHLDTGICLVFLLDFLHRLHRARDQAKFLFPWGLIDLLSSIPALPALRWGRVFRVYRLLRVLRAFRSTKLLLEHLYRRRGRAICATAACACLLVALFSSLAILNFEDRPDANIHTAGDGLWWSLYTLANMDYLGLYPVSFEGKLIRFLLVISGMVLFAVFTGYAASLFMAPGEAAETDEISALRHEVARLREQLGQEKPPL
ncbi:MAG: ion transporter [Elusimicrobia bacterium]|nr:ion transporter [Elusimicrobiota bacterium]